MNSLLLQLILLLASVDSDELTDPELAIKIKNGNHEAFKKFFDRYNAFLLNYLMKRGTAKEAAKDLVQQAFVMIWEKRDEIDETKSLRAFLFRIGYTRMLNLFRDHSKFDEEADPEENTSHEEPEDEDNKRAELNSAIEQAISAMPEKRQEVFRLCFIQEFTYKEAAQVLDVSVKTVENHMGLALKDMRESLKQYRL
ncbi:RNA polymerase sigma-70 factor [Balneola sp. EhC07]|uniref:RNA polymerase sigma factor n=1 Tax=Balneola sp. EhC07 TaxID=1849360 RepID=UPI0007F3C6E9|nr:RNA polymerase sigma-70 factor [Balneola sp. EhC07]OAN64614.1 RNA polymerase sigma-70 factor [Balneola sp. EhC07]